ncbi:MAG: ribonuclease III [Candidatus Levybacteria bacterium]|nr:ribonuclease III [Candidatus Levybacteria bacterium]
MINLPKIKNKKLLQEALTHRSFLNESREKTLSNERLEFLGDSILSFIVSTHLFTNYPEFNEGKLTNLRSLLVNTKTLAQAANECDLGSRLRLSKGEEDSGGRKNQSLLADAFEAFIGALFLDQGISEVEKFLKLTIILRIEGLIQKNILKDPKSILQEYVQARKQNSPLYKVLSEEGPAHKRQFLVGVFVGEKLIGKGEGRSKQEAEENAAEKALEGLEK